MSFLILSVLPCIVGTDLLVVGRYALRRAEDNRTRHAGGEAERWAFTSVVCSVSGALSCLFGVANAVRSAQG